MDRLPDEVLVKIFRFVKEMGLVHLFSLAKTSKRMQRLAFDPLVWDGSRISKGLFLLLTKNDALRTRTELEIDYGGSPLSFRGESLHRLEKLVLLNARLSPGPFAVSWRARLREIAATFSDRDPHHPFVRWLYERCPHLEVLSVGARIPFVDGITRWQRLEALDLRDVSFTGREVAFLPRLEYFSYRSDEARNPFNLSFLAEAPRLRYVNLDLRHWHCSAVDFLLLKTEELETLSLDRAAIDGDFGRVLCKFRKSLKNVWARRVERLDLFSVVHDALESVAISSLTELQIQRFFDLCPNLRMCTRRRNYNPHWFFVRTYEQYLEERDGWIGCRTRSSCGSSAPSTGPTSCPSPKLRRA